MNEQSAKDDELEGAEDPRWHALTLGTLSEDEAATLRVEAPERYELRRPFSADERDRLFTRVEETLDAKARIAAPRSAQTPWWQRRPVQISAGFALAAMLALSALPLRSPAVEVAWSPPRGGEFKTPRLSSDPNAPPADRRLSEVIVPVRPVRGRLVVRGALLARPWTSEPGHVRAWNLDAEPTIDNTIVIAGTRGELFPGAPSGEWEMYVALGRPGPLLSEGEMLRLAGKGTAGDVQVLEKRVVLDGPCVGTRERPCRDDAP
jgi:hypothetical protein